MISEEQAEEFARDWIASWNAHDLDRIMAHYDEDVEYSSMFLLRLSDNKAGALWGKKNVREYLAKGLATYPDLQFKLLRVFVGVRSIVLHYRSVDKLVAAEVFELSDNGLVSRVQCHYCQD